MPSPNFSGKQVTLRDIGKALGVSHSTVSLALRNHPRISQAMRGKVQKAAEEMGYRPDPMLAALANYRRGREHKPICASLGWINGWADPDALRGHREFDCYWKGAKATAERLGYRLEEFRLGGSMTAERVHEILSARGVRGLLLPPHLEKPDWAGFPWDEYSLVRFGRSLQEPRSHLVTSDQVANTILAYQSMVNLGYERIGFVAHEFELREKGLLFELGFYGGQKIVEGGGEVPPLLLGREVNQDSRREFKDWIKKHKPDAIFTTLPQMPEMVAEIGLKVPDDIGLAATTLIDTEVDAGIDQHPEEIGRVGFLMLNALVTDGSRGIPKYFRQNLVGGSWVDGKNLPMKR